MVYILGSLILSSLYDSVGRVLKDIGGLVGRRIGYWNV